jgi:arginine decarboxylase
MNIFVAGGVGEGSTLLSAFDNALAQINILNFNLLILSSVIPPGSVVQQVDKLPDGAISGQFGDRLYVVRAECRGKKQGEVLGSIVGWYQFQDGRGLFTEHELVGTSETEVSIALREEMVNTLRDLCTVRNVEFDLARVGSKLVVTTVQDKPQCALVVAVYEANQWMTL